ncbi:colon cancer-associated protein Mic1-like-domain-containing protein [Powellomyces hirtus]|nr:colon cancer-associated protein Mic1-like-domain-containing protein [Powellomyces hirtus]
MSVNISSELGSDNTHVQQDSDIVHGTESLVAVNVVGEPSVHFTPVVEFTSLATDASSVFFDASRQTVLLVLGDSEIEVKSGPDCDGRRIHVGHTGSIRDAKLAPGGAFLGVLRSAKMLEIMEVTSSERAESVQEIIRDSHSSDAILGFEWIYPGELMVVNGSGFDLYQYSENAKRFVQKKSREHRINWYSYWPESQVLVTSVKPLTLRLFHLRPDVSIEQLMVLDLKPAGKRNTLQAQATRRQIVVLQVTYPLDGRGTFVANVVDNLIIVFNLVTKLSLLFDLKYESAESVIPAKRIPFDCEDDLDMVIEWQPGFPDFILVAAGGILYRLRLHLQSIAEDMRTRSTGFDVIAFLVRRDISDPSLILQIVSKMMEEGTDPAVMRKVFDMLKTGGESGRGDPSLGMIRDTSNESVNSLASFGTADGILQHSAQNSPALPRIPNTAGPTAALRRVSSRRKDASSAATTQLCSQELFFLHVFNPFASNTIISLTYLTTCLLEYIASVSLVQRVQPYFHELLADLLVRSERYAELHQYVQYNVVEDSMAVAQLLLSRGQSYKPFEQLGVDMLKRLDANTEVGDILLSCGEVLDALRYTMSRGVTNIPATHFLEAALVSGDKTLYLNTYKCLEDRGLISSNMDQTSTGFPPGAATNRYISVFREMWGEVVEMDSMMDM